MAQPIVVENAEHFARMPLEYQELVKKQLTAHAEGDLNCADNYIMVAAPMAPDAFELRTCYANAADEVDHYHRTAKVLSEIGLDCSYMLRQRLEARTAYPTELLNRSHIDRATWIARGLTSLLAEGAALEIIEEMCESSYRPFAAICPRIHEEEKVHVGHGYRISAQFCSDRASLPEVQNALALIWPMVLDLFGRSTSTRSQLYVKWGLRKYENEEARQRFIELTRPKLQGLGLEVPDAHANRRFV